MAQGILFRPPELWRSFHFRVTTNLTAGAGQIPRYASPAAFNRACHVGAPGSTSPVTAMALRV